MRNVFQELVSRIEPPVRQACNILASPRTARLVGKPFSHIMGMRSKCQDIDLSRVRRALVVRPDEIGDVVMTTPFLRELRRNMPDAWITLVIKPAVYDLVELCPYVDEILTYDWNVHGRLRLLRLHWRAFWFARQHLWRRHFDLAIVPRWDRDSYDSAFVAYFSGSPLRVGYSESVTEQKRRMNAHSNGLFTHVIDANALKHEVEHNLYVIRFLGGTIEQDRLELWLGAEDEAYAEAILAGHGVMPGGVVAAVSPSTGGSRLKQWPVANFIEIGRWLCKGLGAHVVLIGGPEDYRSGLEIESAIGHGVINMMGKTTLRQSAALIQRSAVFVGNDMGVVHIAAAVGIPVVALFGASCPHRFAPFGKAHTVVWSSPGCGPCSVAAHQDSCKECAFAHPPCMSDISVDRVEDAIIRLLEARQPDFHIDGITGNVNVYAAP